MSPIKIKELQRQGLGHQQIAGRLNPNRKSVAKYMKVEDFNGSFLGKEAPASTGSSVTLS